MGLSCSAWERAIAFHVMLKFMIGVGAAFTIALWVFYFAWLRPRLRRERQGISASRVQEAGNAFADMSLAKCNVEALKASSQFDVASLLGMQPMSQFDWAQLIVRGFPVEAFEIFVGQSGLTKNETIKAIGMTSRQLFRRRHSGALSGEESERLYRLARIISRVAAFFGDIESGAAWLRKPHPVLRGFAPLELTLTEPGAQEVLRIITSVEHGIPV